MNLRMSLLQKKTMWLLCNIHVIWI